MPNAVALLMTRKLSYILFPALSLIVFLISKDFPLFWDTIQFAGKHSLFYYENDFSIFFLPESIDSGHIPVFGMYLAALWKVFGKSLFVSHLVMLPFIFLNLFFAFRLGRIWTEENRYSWLFPILMILMPTSLSQFVLVSPDIVLLCFFLAVLYFIETKKSRWLVIASVGLAVISVRGFMVLSGIIFWHLFMRNDNGKRPNYFKIWPYVPALILFFIYQIAHKYFVGWIGLHVDMPWYDSFALPSPQGFFKNIVVYIWRLLDFGMIFLWFGLLVQFLRMRKEFFRSELVKLLLILIVLFGFITIPFSGLMQHRYFLPIYVLAGFIFIKNLVLSKNPKRSKIVVGIVVAFGLVSGNFWIYPDKIAQGWDSTLAHIPYYSMQADMIDSIEQKQIDFKKVGTEFPMRSPFKELFLNDSELQFSRKNMSEQEYILWSNIINDFSDAEIDELSQQWKEVVDMKRGGVKMILYQKDEF